MTGDPHPRHTPFDDVYDALSYKSLVSELVRRAESAERLAGAWRERYEKREASLTKAVHEGAAELKALREQIAELQATIACRIIPQVPQVPVAPLPVPPWQFTEIISDQTTTPTRSPGSP